jgi:hypothetical protein
MWWELMESYLLWFGLLRRVLLCFALRWFDLICFALPCLALICIALRWFALLCFDLIWFNSMRIWHSLMVRTIGCYPIVPGLIQCVGRDHESSNAARSSRKPVT